MISAQLVGIATATALAFRLTVAVIANASVQFIPEVADAVWTYSGRTLGKVDSLAFNLWDDSVQVLGDHTTAAASKNLVDQPVIESMFDAVPDLSNKLDSTAEALSRLSLDFQLVTSEVSLLGLKWDSLQAGEATQSLDELISALGSNDQLTWLNRAWGWPTLRRITSRVALARESLVSVRQTISTTGLQPVAYLQLKSALTNLESAQRTVGDNSDAAEEQTVYGHFRQTQELTAAWVIQQSQLTDLLDQWNKVPASQLEAKVTAATSSVLALNQIPGAAQFLAGEPKAKILDLVELAQVNKNLLAQDAYAPVVGTWLEEDPLVIRTLIVNPSAVARRNIAVKYYLPSEIKEKDILSHDSDLEVKYDSGREQYYVEGELVLAAEDTKVLGVQVADLWQFDQIDVDDLHGNATELAQPLRGKAGLALKSDIDASLVKISALQSQAVTPEKRIKAFRQASSELATVTVKLEQLQKLANRAGLTSNLLNSMSAGEPVIVGIAGVAMALLLVLALSTGHKARHTVSVHQFRAFSEDIGNSDL